MSFILPQLSAIEKAKIRLAFIGSEDNISDINTFFAVKEPKVKELAPMLNQDQINEILAILWSSQIGRLRISSSQVQSQIGSTYQREIQEESQSIFPQPTFPQKSRPIFPQRQIQPTFPQEQSQIGLTYQKEQSKMAAQTQFAPGLQSTLERGKFLPLNKMSESSSHNTLGVPLSSTPKASATLGTPASSIPGGSNTLGTPPPYILGSSATLGVPVSSIPISSPTLGVSSLTI